MKVHRKLIVAYVLTGLFPMCLMFTLFYTQMRRVLVEREIKICKPPLIRQWTM